MGFAQQAQIDAEAGIGRLGTGNGLKRDIDRRALRQQQQRGRHVAEHARLRGNGVLFAHPIEQFQQLAHGLRAVGGRVDAQQGVAAAVEQAIDEAGGDAARVVGGVVGLEAGGQAAALPQRITKARDDFAAPGHANQLLVAQQLAHGRHHFRRQAGGQGG